MPLLTVPLVDGYAIVDVLIGPSAARLLSLRGASLPSPGSALFQALIDTGAGISCIDPSVRQGLNLTPFTVGDVNFPGSAPAARANRYKVSLTVRHPGGNPQLDLTVPLLGVLETTLAQTGYRVILGCDVLARCDFHYAGRRGTFALAY
jgi:hypothetical protein